MPRFRYDAFISYSHLDDRSPTSEPGWVTQFYNAFRIELSRRLGRDASIWRDDRLNGEGVFDKIIQTALDNSAILIALYSASYIGSDFCRKEREWFVRAAQNSPYGLNIGDQTRLFNVQLMNSDPAIWPKEFAGRTGFKFFRAPRPNDKNRRGFTLSPRDPEFMERVEDIVIAVDDVLSAIEQREEQGSKPEISKSEISMVAAVAGHEDAVKAPNAAAQEGAPLLGARLLETIQFERLKESFRRRFQLCFGQIRILSARKNLHDQLHELQFKFFTPISEILQDNVTSADARLLEIVHEHNFFLSEILDELRVVIAAKLLPDNEVGWVEDVATAQGKLEQAMRDMDLASAQAAIRTVGRVLAIWPSRINAKLNETVRELALDHLIAELHLLCTESSTFAYHLGDKVQKFEKLSKQIAELAAIHDDWQSVDDELRLVDSSLKQNFRELEECWPSLKEKTARLNAKTPEKLQRLAYWGEEMDRALQQKNLEDALRFFLRYRSAARDQFYAADQNLKRGCQELEQVGEPIESALRSG